MGVKNAFPQALGLKLPLAWREDQAHGRLPALNGDAYGFLRGCGFDFVEFATAACADQGELALLRRETAACRQAGLSVALHPYLWGACNPAQFGQRPDCARALHAVLCAASAAAELCDAPVTVVLHAAEARCEPAGAALSAFRAELLERSRLFFAEAERRVAASHPGVLVTAEHQLPSHAGEPVIRIGDTCAELLDTVAGTALGLCWDTGHYRLGVERYGQPEPPSAEFLRLVRHVHLHDVVGGADHRVIGPQSARVRGYAELLQRSAFTGTITLEYALDAIQSAGGLEKVAREAPGILAAWRVSA
jgi:sugar phosphate isomerase/epimerase